MKKTLNLSIVIPALNEEASVESLYHEIANVVKNLNISFEIIFVDDGSTDNTFEILQKLHKKDKRVKVVKLRGNWGKSSALQVGFKNSRGEAIITMDADLQDDPKEIPNFLTKLDEGYDLVTGWKKERHDPITKVVPSRMLNFVTSLITGVKIHDTNCGFKSYKRELVDNLNLYGELYRFIPILAAKQNYKVGEIVIKHKAREHGVSKYGWERNTKGLLDLITIIFITGYSRRPGHFFGTLGLISFSGGFVIGLYIAYLRITTGSIQFRHPLLFLGMLLMIIGVQLVTTGLLAEMVVSFNQKRNNVDKAISKIIT